MRKKHLISKTLLLYLCYAPSTPLPFHYFHSFSVFPYLVDHLLQPFFTASSDVTEITVPDEIS